jgi:hypothetical protein
MQPSVRPLQYRLERRDIFLRMYQSARPLPRAGRFLPLYYLTLAWQFAHFGEEFGMHFQSRFPELYGDAPFPNIGFILFHIISYLLVLILSLAVFVRRLHYLMILVVFFIVCEAIGNAVAHTFWTVTQGEYFPGFFTAQAYWILGPLMLIRLTGSRRDALISTAAFATMLVVILTVFTPHLPRN